MKARVLALAALAVLALAAPASAQPGRMGVLTPTPGKVAPEVYLYTFGRGEVIFEKFGHTALCLDYHEPDRETACFNYGVTDFSIPGSTLAWRFVRGKQVFFVEAIPLSGMLRFYIHEDRTIWKQRLPISEAEARAIEAKLLDDLDPRKGSYIYDHFVDNCTTRLRDIINEGTGGKLKSDTARAFPVTLREMGMSGMAEFPALIAFGDFAVGRYLDHHPSVWAAMFHPFVLRDEVDRHYGARAEVVYERRQPPIPDDGPTGRGWALLIGLAFVVPLLAARLAGRLELTATILATLPLFLMGLIIWSAAILSTIPSLRWNEALLLYYPGDLVLPFLYEARRRRYARYRLAGVVLVSLLTAVGVLRQPLWVPIAIAFAMFSVLGFERRPFWRR